MIIIMLTVSAMVAKEKQMIWNNVIRFSLLVVCIDFEQIQ